MENLYQEFKKSYLLEKKSIVAQNNRYLDRNYKNINLITNDWKKTFNILIPAYQRKSSFFHYMHINKSICSKGDTILRYIPFVENKKDMKGIPYFDYVSLQDITISYDYEIFKKIWRKIFRFCTDKRLFQLLEKIKNKSFDAKIVENEFSKLTQLVKFCNVPLEYLVFKWEEYFDRAPYQLIENKTILSQHFCGVCFIFDCNWHMYTKDLFRKF
ncbi:hypothetical protein GVAV_000635 [Gurleya vavrai]